MKWLIKEWPYAALFAGVLLLCLLPFFLALGLPLTLIFLQLPLYMLHQFEEHDRDRFRIFANQVVGQGREAFTPLSIFIINSVGVWGIDLLALYLAFYVDLSFGLLAIYLPLVNAFAHIAALVALRRYNPGLWTAILLFIPFGIWSLLVVSQASGASAKAHALALGAAILVHVAILAFIKLRLRRLT